MPMSANARPASISICCKTEDRRYGTLGSPRRPGRRYRRSRDPRSSVMQATIVTDEVATVAAVADGDRLLIERARFATRWVGSGSLKASAAARCASRFATPRSVMVRGKLDVGACRRARPARRRPTRPAGIAGSTTHARREALREQHRPAFTLPDLDGSSTVSKNGRRQEEAARRVRDLVRLPIRPARWQARTTSWRATTSRSSRWRSTSRPTTYGRGPRASRSPCSSTRNTS